MVPLNGHSDPKGVTVSQRKVFLRTSKHALLRAAPRWWVPYTLQTCLYLYHLPSEGLERNYFGCNDIVVVVIIVVILMCLCIYVSLGARVPVCVCVAEFYELLKK